MCITYWQFSIYRSEDSLLHFFSMFPLRWFVVNIWQEIKVKKNVKTKRLPLLPYLITANVVRDQGRGELKNTGICHFTAMSSDLEAEAFNMGGGCSGRGKIICQMFQIASHVFILPLSLQYITFMCSLSWWSMEIITIVTFAKIFPLITNFHCHDRQLRVCYLTVNLISAVKRW